MTDTIGSSALVLFAGALQGVYALPMKYAKGWKYENIWLVFTALALVVLPWLLTVLTIPHLGMAYASSSPGTLFAIVGFGLAWGVGVALTGLSLTMLGIGLTFAIVLGLSASVGSLIPLLVFDPGKIASHQGHMYLLGAGVMLIGIACGARSGYLRDQRERGAGGCLDKTRFVAGLAVAVVAGLACSSLNFCYAFGAPAARAAEMHGASSLWSSNVITALATTGGFVANLAYCGHLLVKNRTAGLLFAEGANSNWLLGFTMAICWLGGQVLYGVGFFRMGDLGAVIGWPLLLGMIIIMSNTAGIFSGEWHGASREIRRYLSASIMLIIVSLGILAAGHGG